MLAMIRINLLSVKQKRSTGAGQKELLIIMVLVAIECLGFFYVHGEKAEVLSLRKKTNKAKSAEIDKLKRSVGDIDKLVKQKEQLEQQQEVLDSLELGRAGPVKVLDEISFLLSAPEDDSSRQRLERRGAMPNWDPRRLWLLSFIEQDRNVTIVGGAKENDDVAEFLTRLASSDYFRDVKLLWTKQMEAADLGGLKFVRFNIRCRISYVGKGEEFVVPSASFKKKGSH